MEKIGWIDNTELRYNQKPGADPRNQSTSVWHPRNAGFARQKSDTIRRIKPPLPLLNPTNFQGSKASFTHSGAHVRLDNWYNGRITDTTHSVGPCFGLSSANNFGDFGMESFFNGMMLRSQTDFMAQLKNKSLLELGDRKLDVLTTLAEGAQTAEYLATRVGTLARSLRAIKRGRIKDFVDAVNEKPPGNRPRWVKNIEGYRPRNPRPLPTTKSPFGGDASSRWLEYNYAVIPVILDVQGAAEALAQYLHEEPDKRGWPLRVKLKKLISLSAVKNLTNSISVAAKSVWKGTGEWRGTIMFWYSVDQSALKRAAALGLISPSVVWEVTPYSFVVDWVVPIGDFLEACTATLGCTFESGWQLERFKGFTFMEEFVGTNTATVVEKPGLGMYSAEGFSRSVLYDFPAPQIYVKNPLSARNALTSAALLRQLI